VVDRLRSLLPEYHPATRTPTAAAVSAPYPDGF
jgi:hypothetical protein